ncbi:hypothetical protein VDG1235_804 [Verrucomicrobiia bacterium DG1235]|nr:hypothetical protein VDG1235_804 [Verrucomicrobiae bacterium DG1235]
MRYLQISAGPWPDEALPLWARALKKLSPANPDLDKLYPKTYKWWLESE